MDGGKATAVVTIGRDKANLEAELTLSRGDFMGSGLLNGDDEHHRFSTNLTP